MRRILSAFFISAFCVACTPMIDTHGSSPDPARLGKLQKGVTPYTQVQALLGSPSSKTVFGHEYWLYITSRQERLAFFKPKETARTVTSLEFDDNGILKDIKTYDLQDGVALPYDPEATEMAGHSVSVTDQLISNIGRFEQKQSSAR